MKKTGHQGKWRRARGYVLRKKDGYGLFAVATLIVLSGRPLTGQSTSTPTVSPETTQERVQQLSSAVLKVQMQMEAYRKELQDLQAQLASLQQQMATEGKSSSTAGAAVAAKTSEAGVSTSSIEEINERQAIEESQIATHEQSKVETESKYPLKVTGLLLFNGFVNTRQVDTAINPTYAVGGGGSTGFSVRQTILGFDARGPRLLGATSYADMRVDFFGNSASQASYAPTGLLRLRTAHAGLKWDKTEAFVALDRPLIAPNVATSLVAAAQPVFAWSGDLWMWVPQIGVKHWIGLGGSKRFEAQAALIDVSDPFLPNNTPTLTVSRSERSRWPGTEARIAFGSGERGVGPEIGIGGYFSPHRTGSNVRFDAWTASMDLRLPMGRHFELTGNAYRGQGLGGLGGGGYVDYYFRNVGGVQNARALDDVGGWAQLKSKIGERVQLNAGYGVDNPFAKEIREAAIAAGTTGYLGLGKNRSMFGNVIYSPSSYLLFSVEYRKLWTDYAPGYLRSSDVIGIGAGYKF